MPIEIRELVIKAVINNKAQKSEQDNSTDEFAGGKLNDADLDEIVQQVLELVQENKNER